MRRKPAAGQGKGRSILLNMGLVSDLTFWNVRSQQTIPHIKAMGGSVGQKSED